MASFALGFFNHVRILSHVVNSWLKALAFRVALFCSIYEYILKFKVNNNLDSFASGLDAIQENWRKGLQA